MDIIDTSRDPHNLKIPMARWLAASAASDQIPFARFIECGKVTRDGAAEVVIIEIDVQVSQIRKNQILPTELIAVLFDPADRRMPEVLALRADFPRVPHLNLRDVEIPRSMCLYEAPYDEIRLTWTPAHFIRRIQEWLRLTALGKLHQPDQPPEPFFLTSDYFLITKSFAGDLASGITSRYILSRRDGGLGKSMIIAEERLQPQKEEVDRLFSLIALKSAPKQSGVIFHNPQTLSELESLLSSEGIELLSHLRTKISGWYNEKPFSDILKSHLLLVLEIPQVREHFERRPESSEMWMFYTNSTIRDIGIDIGVFEPFEKDIGLIFPPDTSKRGSQTSLAIAQPIFSHSIADAKRYNEVAGEAGIPIVAVGAGSLGSQIMMNCARSGFGKWTILDKDWMLPHNLSRHELGSQSVGFPKASTLGIILNDLFDTEEIAKAIEVDILNPCGKQPEIDAVFAGTGLILDMSASIPAARFLANDISSPGRRVSVFLNQTGSDSVFLAEDQARKVPLDWLEMQYYRYVLSESVLAGHISTPIEQVRYGRSCRDVSSKVPHNRVSLHASILSSTLIRNSENHDATIRVWRIRESDLSVAAYEFPVHELRQNESGGWRVRFDDWLIERINEIRRLKLPNETGGVLLGSFDTSRKMIYVIDCLPSPPDSQEWPTLYIRGSKDLGERLKVIGEATAGMIHYIGEWHSHPEGSSSKQSKDDRHVLDWLTKHMHVDGLPGVMLIAGSDYSWYVRSNEQSYD